MNHEEKYQDIEPSVMFLGATYAASIIGMILWLLL